MTSSIILGRPVIERSSLFYKNRAVVVFFTTIFFLVSVLVSSTLRLPMAPCLLAKEMLLLTRIYCSWVDCGALIIFSVGADVFYSS